MALDCYIVKESNGGCVVHRYKAKELLDSTHWNQGEWRRFGKREKIAERWTSDGKPRFAVYWLEGAEIKSKQLGQRVIVGTVANGYAQVWDHGVLHTIRVPKGMTRDEFEDVLNDIVKRGKDDDQWVDPGGTNSNNAYGVGVFDLPTIPDTTP